jgi:hypothetical protein
MRFQKRIKVIPGVTINLSRKGVSTSLGVTGARVTYGHGEKRTTIGVPGTGISHSQVERTARAQQHQPAQENDTGNLLLGIGFIAALMFGAWVISKLF